MTGSELRLLRHLHELRQADVAAQMHVSRSRIRMIEVSRRPPTPAAASRYIEAVHAAADALGR
jgi:transcriptional regulator with XRE-family HTH domain